MQSFLEFLLKMTEELCMQTFMMDIQ